MQICLDVDNLKRQKLISKMDQLTNLPVFKSIQISLACQACIDAEKTHEWYVFHKISHFDRLICFNMERSLYAT